MVTIRNAKPENVPEIKSVLYITWKSTYGNAFTEEQIKNITDDWHNPERLLKQTYDPETVFYVAIDENEKMVGVLTAGIQENGTVLYIARLYILPDHQGKRIGSQLLETLIKNNPQIKTLKLDVEKENEKAYTFYIKKGFVPLTVKEEKVAGVLFHSTVIEKNVAVEGSE